MMVEIGIVEDPEECARIWADCWPEECLFDLWPVRDAFSRGFRRTPCFVVARQDGKNVGLLALSRIEEMGGYGHFPGETYQAKTWLEQNKIPAQNSEVLSLLLENVPGKFHVRYLTGQGLIRDLVPLAVDEVGYLFLPGTYGYSFSEYLQAFSGKSRKKLGRELEKLEAYGVSYRFDHLADVELLFRMNRESFGRKSYFGDPRFQASFENLVKWLADAGMLRVTCLMLGGRVAAVDVGAVWKHCYTVLAGGTDPAFPGVAKMINFHHLEWSCRQRHELVDFLCGDFGWKQRFHLTERPLFELTGNFDVNEVGYDVRAVPCC